MFSEKEILSFIEQYSKTSEGKKEIQKHIKGEFIPKYPTGRKNFVKSIEEAKVIAEDMKQILFKHISAVINSFELDDIIVEAPFEGELSGFVIKVRFDSEALQRKSLRPDLYPDGLEDIVSLFVHGYDTDKTVYGIWEGHGDTPIFSRKNREPNDFMKKAVDEFNGKHGLVAKAELEPAYKN